MNLERFLKTALFFFLCTSLQFLTPCGAIAQVDNSVYAALLKQYVENGRVDYRGLKGQEARLDSYLKILENTDIKKLSSDDKLAFYINAYNAWTLKLILTGYPGIDSIKDMGSLFKSPWKKKIISIDQRLMSLDHLEHDILRPQFKDPRIHFAVNCASKGCPVLKSEPYSGLVIGTQLDEVTRRFVNEPGRYRLEDNNLYLSRIFKWFPEDFNHDPGGFFIQYADPLLKQKLVKIGDRLKIKYLAYDWSLNGE